MKNFNETSNTKRVLPKEFLNDFENYFGKDFLLKYQDEYQKPSVRGLRVNNKYLSSDSFEKLFNHSIEKISYFDNAYYLNTADKLGNTSLHHCGAYYLQEPSSMIPVASVVKLDFNDKVILDLCASPGGKSTQINSLMQGGILISNEIEFKRCQTLFSNIERLGLKNVIVTNESPQRLANVLQNKCDYIFVDAPCSGEGMFRKDDLSVAMWNSNLKNTRSILQTEILDYANKMLKKDGILVYSTCTYNVVENEMVVEDFINKYDYSVLDVNKDVKMITFDGVFNKNKQIEKTKHFFPFLAKGEGQYVAVLKKNEDNKNTVNKFSDTQKLSSTELKIVKNFLKDVLISDITTDVDIEKINGSIHLLPKHMLLNLNDIKIICKGVILGEIKNNILFPHHQFFSSYGDLFKSYFNLDNLNNNIAKYIFGEQLFVNELIDNSIDYCLDNTKYAVIKVNGVSLGGVKVVDNCLKNLYPKGLRAKINN